MEKTILEVKSENWDDGPESKRSKRCFDSESQGKCDLDHFGISEDVRVVHTFTFHKYLHFLGVLVQAFECCVHLWVGWVGETRRQPRHGQQIAGSLCSARSREEFADRSRQSRLSQATQSLNWLEEGTTYSRPTSRGKFLHFFCWIIESPFLTQETSRNNLSHPYHILFQYTTPHFWAFQDF